MAYTKQQALADRENQTIIKAKANQSDLFRWLAVRIEALTPRMARDRSSVLSELQEAGITKPDGSPVTPTYLRQTWHKVARRKVTLLENAAAAAAAKIAAAEAKAAKAEDERRLRMDFYAGSRTKRPWLYEPHDPVAFRMPVAPDPAPWVAEAPAVPPEPAQAALEPQPAEPVATVPDPDAEAAAVLLRLTRAAAYEAENNRLIAIARAKREAAAQAVEAAPEVVEHSALPVPERLGVRGVLAGLLGRRPG